MSRVTFRLFVTAQQQFFNYCTPIRNCTVYVDLITRLQEEKATEKVIHTSIMSPSCDVCGWIAAFGGMLAFGSFGVPIKSKVAQSLDIDPLVMQT